MRAAPAVAAPAWLGTGALLTALGLLAAYAIDAHRRAACLTGETLLLRLCEAPAPAAVEATLRERLAANPGDTRGWRLLAMNDRSSRHNERIETALRLAPTQPQLLVHQAAAALDRGDTTRAAESLVAVADHYDVPLAARALAQMVATGKGGALLAAVRPGSTWVARVIAELKNLRAPLSLGLPLIVRGLEVGALDAATVRGYVGELKAAGAWADAYALWLATLGKSSPALFNGSFDQPIEPDGFDWELPAGSSQRAGVIVERRNAEGRGAVLDLQFTGRSITPPMARQLLFIGTGRYRLKGEYRARNFRSDQGMAWSVMCKSSVQGLTKPLGDTGGEWLPFAMEFRLPPDCGLVATLQLAPAAPTGAAVSARGQMAFDALTLERLP